MDGNVYWWTELEEFYGFKYIFILAIVLLYVIGWVVICGPHRFGIGRGASIHIMLKINAKCISVTLFHPTASQDKMKRSSQPKVEPCPKNFCYNNY
jgi:hypothetical protein